MKRGSMIDLFNGTNDEFVSAAIASRKAAPAPKLRTHNIFLIVVAVCVAALLAGSGIASVLNKLGNQKATQGLWNSENTGMVTEIDGK